MWRKVYVTASQPDTFGSIGTIAVPDGSPPTAPSGYNWLFTGISWEQKAQTYVVHKEWRLSGRHGWNSTIYS
jgi:hypothetical protein